jgi:hypothetical protein
MLPLNVSKQSNAWRDRIVKNNKSNCCIGYYYARVLPWRAFHQDRLPGNGAAALMHPAIAPQQIDVMKLHQACQLAGSASSIGFIAGHSALARAARGSRPLLIRGRSATMVVFMGVSWLRRRAVRTGPYSFHGSQPRASAIWRRDAGKSNTLCWSDYITRSIPGGDQLGPQTHQFGLARHQ